MLKDIIIQNFETLNFSIQKMKQNWVQIYVPKKMKQNLQTPPFKKNLIFLYPVGTKYIVFETEL